VRAVRVLAGDVGGTNARFAIVNINGSTARVEREQHYASQEARSLTSLVRRFIADVGDTSVQRACFAVACGVIDGVCRGANLPWTIDERELGDALSIPRTTLINDFDAIGHGLALLELGDIETLQHGESVLHGPIALIGAGTGLGEAFLIWDGIQYRVQPSEGGHVNFAARDDLEWGLYSELVGEFEHVSYERVVSGPGLIRIYRYLAAAGGVITPDVIRNEMRQEDPAAVIVRHALAETDAVCTHAVDLFTSLLGAQAGNLALTVFAVGGVYVAGGIAPRIVHKLRTGPFLPSFHGKGRVSNLVRRMPVHVITNTNVGLLGAARVAANPP
jgi:glucokinase